MKVDILVFTLLAIYQYAYAQQNREKLTDVKTLTLRKGLMTTGRRTKPVLQAQCQDTSSVRCYNNEPDVIQCENVGNNGPYVNWKCTANLPLNIRFTEIKVICEGYDGPADPYVLKGSCGLKYKLEKYQSVQQPTTNKNNNIFNIKNNNNVLFPYLQQNKVKMTDLKQLTFKKGAMTTARRTTSISQAQCVDSKSVLCASVAQPNTIDCKIVGINAVNIIWECRGELPTNIRFDDVKVSCEGYDYPGDSYVLVGSCGLKYTLERYKTETTPAMKNNNNNNLINYINLLNTDTQKNKVKLTDVKQLTFTKGAMTTGRRTSPVLQAQCVDSASVSCGSITQPNAIDCKIAGINGDKIIWECRGNLPENIRFDDLKVSCEGYDSSSDPYVLTGSCGLKYTLEKYKTETPPNNNINKNLNNPDSKQQNKVLMTDVKQLTFKKGAMTTAKRVAPILQSQCIDSNSVSCSSVTQPNTIDCKVVGIKEDKAIWECRGELPEDIRFDDLKVSCEGFDYPSDPYVLIGSCGLKYTLERYKSETPSSSNNNNNNNNFNNNINFYKPDTQQNKVKLADVKKLAFTKGAMTTARRSSPVLQIQCVDDVSVACSSVALPNTIDCENTGSYSGNINWNCKANFPNGIRFAKTVVTCEGYDNSDDPFILFGSCGLKYSLETYQSGNPPNSNNNNNWINNNNNNNNWINSNNNWNNNNNFVISPDLQNRVSLASLQRLTFTKGALTTSRRYAPVRQAQCIDSFTVPCYGNEPNQIECVKSGYNDPKIIWNCRANLPPTLRLGNVKVDCEGYDNPNDIYIVSGSCYVKYTLENQYGVPPNNNYNNYNNLNNYNNNFDNSNRVINFNDDNRFTTGYNDSTNKESSTIRRIAIGSLIAFTVLTVIVALVFVLCVISSHRGYKLIK